MSFQMGQLVATPGAIRAFEAAGQIPIPFLQRHLAGDWGDCDDEDTRANDDALARGGRLFSVYHLNDGTKIWIITEADRSATTILLPEEY